MKRSKMFSTVLVLGALCLACGGEEGGGEASGGRSGGPGGGPGGMPGFGGAEAAVPVEAVAVERRAISSFIETNGTLEAENEVDIVSRVAGPIVELNAEETMLVERGELLARIDPSEIMAEREIARVALEEAKLAYERAERLREEELLSAEAYEDAKAAYESAQAQFQGNEIQLGYTEIRAPFKGLIIERYVKFAQHVVNGDQLFRISDFDPLLCRIQVPERNLAQLREGQRAYLTVEAFPGERFEARVLRLSPVVEAATGTVRVTLEVRGQGRLRPGMFASVFLETETREGALVIPKKALALESVGDTVYVVGDGVAVRREVELGFREGDSVEVLSGLEEGERIVSIGQDGLSDGTPIQVLGDAGAAPGAPAGATGGAPGTEASPAGAPGSTPGGAPGAQASPGGFASRMPDLATATPEQIERIKERMRSFGMTDEQIEQRLEQIKQTQAATGDDD